MGKQQSGTKLGKGGCPGKSDLNPHRVTKMERYRTRNTRYKNKVKRAEKRYGRCKPETLKKVISKIVTYRKNYTKTRI